MTQSSVRVAEPLIQSTHDDQEPPQPIRDAEILHPVEYLHQRFDDAYDRAEQLSVLLQVRQSRGFECSTLLGMLKVAEAEKKASLAALRKARWLKVVSAA